MNVRWSLAHGFPKESARALASGAPKLILNIFLMLISFGYDISLRLEVGTTVLFCLKISSFASDLVSCENFRIEPQKSLRRVFRWVWETAADTLVASRVSFVLLIAE